MGVTFELLAALTGHEVEALCKAWHYICPGAPILEPGASVLGGWGQRVYGRIGKGAQPASLDPLTDRAALTFEKRNLLINQVLNLREGCQNNQAKGA